MQVDTRRSCPKRAVFKRNGEGEVRGGGGIKELTVEEARSGSFRGESTNFWIDAGKNLKGRIYYSVVEELLED